MKLLILTPIAERDVHFYLAAANELTKNPDVKIVFYSFYQPDNDLITSAGYEVLDPYSQTSQSPPAHWTEAYVEKHFSVPPLDKHILHEKLTFGIGDDKKVVEKFLRYAWAAQILLAGLEQKYPEAKTKHVLQELAGFVGPLSLFYVSKKMGWQNWMTEPSFYKGRIHLVSNSLYLDIPDTKIDQATKISVAKYIDKAFKEKVVVAAVKDAHHYKDMGIKKIFNPYNFSKLAKKISNKYVFGKKQEFEHIGNHVGRYLLMLINRIKNEKNYSQIADVDKSKSLFYFPFHVQLDFSLTIRSPDWLDQLALIEKLIQHLPDNSVLLAKEHPASIGCLDQQRLEVLLKNPKFKLLHPMINSHDVLEVTKAVITINSKVGAEALSKGIPVFTFGKAFYTDRGLTPHFKNWQVFQEWLNDIHNNKPTHTAQAWRTFLEYAWQDGFDTELYELSQNNMNNFTHGIRQKLGI